MIRAISYEIYYEILDSDYTEAFNKLDRAYSFEDYSFIEKLKEYILNNDFSWHFYTKIIDILKLLKRYSDIEDFKESDLKPKTFEIIEEYGIEGAIKQLPRRRE